MPAPPARTELADTYPNPSNGVLRTGMGRLYDYVTGLLGTTGNAVQARIALGAASDDDVVHLSGSEWHGKAIGEVFYLRDDLAGVSKPPTDSARFRYIKLTAADAYNAGVLSSESVTGSAPDVIATAVISLAGSPINGLTVNLLNTERRFMRAGSSGTLETDEFKSHAHTFQGPVPLMNIGGASADGPVSNTRATANGTLSTGGTETRPKNQGGTAYMRIK